MKDEYYENIFYFNYLNEIGGTEQFLYYLSCYYKNFVVFYKDKDSDIRQIDRLGDNVEVLRYKGGILKCKRFFGNYNADIIDNVEAEEYIQVIHLNYKLQERTPRINPKITKYIGVSQSVCDDFYELTGIKAECIYNPVYIEKPRKILRLISATRLTDEKGKNEMIRLGDMLDEAKIPYIWLVFTNDYKEIKNPHIVYMKPTLEIDDYIADCDYLVQLSKSESYCFSVVQALMLGVPVIVREMDLWKEIGLINGVNSFILDYNLTEVDVDKIYKGLGKFEYTPLKSNWDKYLKKESKYNPNEIVEVKANKDFFDVEEKIWRKKGKNIKCTKKRKNRLTNLDLIDIM